LREIELVLAQVPLFASLPHGELEYLATALRPVKVEPGALLFREGEYGDHFYVILAGQLQVIKALGTPEEVVVGVRGPGEFIGEMSLLNREGLRTASVRALSHSRLLEMTRADFDALLQRQPGMAYEMVQVLSARLKSAQDDIVRDLQDKNRQLVQAFEELKGAQAQIIEKEKLERELEVAHNIQVSLLPRWLPQVAGFDFGAQIVPMSAVGGDFYDFIPLDHQMLGIAIGDVSGHGVPAALFMALTVTLLRAEACRTCSPAEVLRGVNRQLLNLNNEGMFVTLLYGVLNCATHEFTFARAGHEPPILCSADGEWLDTDADLACGQLLGLFDDLLLCEQTWTLPSGSTLLLYTDGVTETMNSQSELFGGERLQAAVCAHRNSNAQAVCERIWKLVTAHRGDAAQRDDITMVCAQAG
jgi:serine phosphatase RsbU (regulator of sigma subunit)